MFKVFCDKVYTMEEIKSIPSTTLAFIGDAYFSLIVRTHTLNEKTAKPVVLHKMTTRYVNAEAQSEFLVKIVPLLNQVEQDIVRRARNAPSNTKSKNYGLAEYKKATGLEALFGYLYLTNQQERINTFLDILFAEGNK